MEDAEFESNQGLIKGKRSLIQARIKESVPLIHSRRADGQKRLRQISAKYLEIKEAPPVGGASFIYFVFSTA